MKEPVKLWIVAFWVVVALAIFWAVKDMFGAKPRVRPAPVAVTQSKPAPDGKAEVKVMTIKLEQEGAQYDILYTIRNIGSAVAYDVTLKHEPYEEYLNGPPGNLSDPLIHLKVKIVIPQLKPGEEVIRAYRTPPSSTLIPSDDIPPSGMISWKDKK